jgi:hypothetical protein
VSPADNGCNRLRKDVVGVAHGVSEPGVTAADDERDTVVSLDDQRLIVPHGVIDPLAVDDVGAGAAVGILAGNLPKCVDSRCDLDRIAVGGDITVAASQSRSYGIPIGSSSWYFASNAAGWQYSSVASSKNAGSAVVWS